MTMRSLALSLAALLLAAPAWAGDRPRGGAPAKPTADDDDDIELEDDDDSGSDDAKADDDDDADKARSGWGGRRGRSVAPDDEDTDHGDDDATDDDDKPARKPAKKPAKKPARTDDDDDADTDEAADDDDKPAKKPAKKPARKPARTDDDADADTDEAADDDDKPARKPAKKPARKPARTDDDADDDDADADADADADDTAGTIDEDDDDLPPNLRAKKPARKKRPAEPEATAEVGPRGVAERHVVPARWIVAVEALGAKPVDGLNGDLFGMGGGASLGVERTLTPALGVHAAASYLKFPAGDAMESTSWALGQLGPRYHLGGALWGATTPHDAWLDAHVTFGTSGGIARPGFDVGAAILWEVSPAVRVGPVVRYAFGADPLDKHAQVLDIGVALGLGGRSRTPIHVEADTDGDGLVDRLDDCAEEVPGDAPDPEHPGCPLRDEDEDGVTDDVDECEDEPAGDRPDPEHAGCPLRDQDGDGILDADDQCPDQAGPTRSGGCPLARVQDQRIEILEQIFFENDSATISDKSQPVLGAIGEVIAGLPEEVRVSIEGHTDEAGSDSYNLNLSKRRARAVAQWLIENAGIAAGRLETQGYGKRRPLVSGPGADTSKNRRVEFVILEAK